jgi:ATP-dependent RNA helicase RhlE
MSFESFAIDPALLAGVRDLGFEQPTDIQQDAIPWGLEGRDVLACAMTGSGKTAAFGLPILQRLLGRPRGVTGALILSPTRELASQIEEHLRALGTHTGLRVASIYGGIAYEPQEKAFREGYEILVATPGRLLDHLRRPYARLDHVEVLILDEADRMLDMGFIPDVRRILQQVPTQRQTMLFSATLPPPIVRLSRDMLLDPVTINLERKAVPAEGVRQAAYPVRHELKPALLLHLLQRYPVESALVFTRTRERADVVGEYLRRAGIGVAVIHGDRTQQHRSRAMDAFKRGEHRVLVATDVAARGIDIEELDVVVNLDVPSAPDDYIHRVGRTARAGSTGDAWTFVAARELADLHLIEKSIGQKIPRIRRDDFDYSPAAAGVRLQRPAVAAPAAGPVEAPAALPMMAPAVVPVEVPAPAAAAEPTGAAADGAEERAAEVTAEDGAEPGAERSFRRRLRRRLEAEPVGDEEAVEAEVSDLEVAAARRPVADPAAARFAARRRARGGGEGEEEGRRPPRRPARRATASGRAAAGGAPAARAVDEPARERAPRPRGRREVDRTAPDRPPAGAAGRAERAGGEPRPVERRPAPAGRDGGRRPATPPDHRPEVAPASPAADEAVDRFAALRARRARRGAAR